MRTARILMLTLCALSQMGCQEEDGRSSASGKRGWGDCKVYGGFDRSPPPEVQKRLRDSGLDSKRLMRKTICGNIISWELLPPGADVNGISPPGMNKQVWLNPDGSVQVSPDDYE